VRELILRRLPAGYQERVAYGMLTYEVPLERYPTTYNNQPLFYIGLASKKNHYTLHLLAAYMGSQRTAVEEAFAAAGKRLDMGKGCLRFKSIDDLPLEAIGDVIAALPVDRWIATYEASRAATSRPVAATKAKPKTTAKKATTAKKRGSRR
jgi:Domain of unknown function (DU1801).